MEKQNISVKKRWTTEEDNALQYIKENLHYKSWNMISKKMASDFGFYYRSEKQCRDRYENYLKNSQKSFNWSQNQERKLFLLFAKEGSKWEFISSHYSNIKGIHIKNKFYTRVRKAIRQVNSVISCNFSKKYQLFHFNIISKLVSLIAKNIEGAKYQKDQASIENLNKNAKTLFQLIQLTNPENYELFPQLNYQFLSQIQKKKQFKKLIKKLQKIEALNDQTNNQQDENEKIEEQNPAFIQQIMKDQKNMVATNIEEKKNLIQCSYKIIQDLPISTQQENYQKIKILSRIRKIKRSSIDEKKKSQQMLKLEHSFQKQQLNNQYSYINSQPKAQSIHLNDIKDNFQLSYQKLNFINSQVDYRLKSLKQDQNQEKNIIQFKIFQKSQFFQNHQVKIQQNVVYNFYEHGIVCSSYQ